MSKTPKINSRWARPNYDPKKGPYNGYTVVAVANTGHEHPDHPVEVIYRGDNGLWWTRLLSDWPGNLAPEKDLYGS